MKKKTKLFISSLLILLITFNYLKLETILTKACSLSLDSNNVNLILDTLKYNDMPQNFRKTSNLTSFQSNKDFNLKGLGALNISGSHQFSEYNLPLIINAIDTSLPITIIDLRQESHGFINEIPISFANYNNNANMGLSKEKVILDENNRLSNIKLDTPISFFNHPEITITPTKVVSENQLVDSSSLSYIRIPVTDGKIPTDDMVNFFVDTVNSKPKNSWFHFHCKEGIGRTTTFMIMYDIITNSKNVMIDDIIKRQLHLANFNEKETISFYNDERINFLKNFYKYSKENDNIHKLKWSDWKKTLSSSSFPMCSLNKNKSNFIKNEITPTSLYVISQDNMTSAERTMIATLQGLVNSNSSSQIYTLNSSEPDYQIWLDDLKNNYGIFYETISNPWELLDKFKSYVYGYILYANKSITDPSINNACSLASLTNSIAIDETIQDKVIEHGITKLKDDLRNTDKYWAYDNLWSLGLNHSIIIELSPDKDTALRDYGIMTKSLIFYEDSIKDFSLREKIFSSAEKDSTCLGWGPDEFINVSTASKYGVSIVAADYSYNLTVLNAFPSVPITQKALQNTPIKKDTHYVTFIISDGDNQQWNLGTNYSSPKWYGSSYRGKFNLGWSLSPSLYYLAPTVYKLYYENASSGYYNDYFLVPPSGTGYMYPSKFDSNALKIYIDRLNNYMKNVDEKYLLILDDSSFYNTKLWDNFTAKNDIQGLFYLDYHKHNNYKGEITYSNNKPIISCRDLLWNGIESEDELVKNINDRISRGEIGINNPNSYTFVYVHAWSKSLDDLNKVVKKLNKNPKVTIVTPETFMDLIRKNITPIK
ncbi:MULTISPECIES: GxGYxYP domain-containing protein [Clostridium]|uniref:Tyrosine specific protein phosphatases domain-containing protein n=1 Tax=Clostridium cibarium TaxID=2762247 RepID=A0ABR8PYK2_9CLOT|nr:MULTISPECIES: GxGYxYP domain-containing protein [Clostridium]MBD7913231.1 hypothetical protein [Clostridium cibarium]